MENETVAPEINCKGDRVNRNDWSTSHRLMSKNGCERGGSWSEGKIRIVTSMTEHKMRELYVAARRDAEVSFGANRRLG